MFDTVKRLSLGLAAVAGAAVGGAAIAGAATSHNATTATPPATAGRLPTGLGAPPAGMPAPGSAKHEDAEKAVTGDAATKAQAAAVKAAGGGTAGDVTTTFFGNGYEVTVTKTDGTKVEYHLDSSFTVMPPPPGGPSGPGAPAGFGFHA